MKLNWRSSAAWLVLGAVATVGFGDCLWSTLGDYRDQRRKAKQYRSVQAEMLYSNLAVKASQGSTTTDTAYHLSVRYRYEVGGKQHESVKFTHHVTWTQNLKYWERMHQKYAKGKTVTAYYDHRNPAEAVLVKRADSGSYWRELVAFGFLLLIGLGVVGIGLYHLFTSD